MQISFNLNTRFFMFIILFIFFSCISKSNYIEEQKISKNISGKHPKESHHKQIKKKHKKPKVHHNFGEIIGKVVHVAEKDIKKIDKPLTKIADVSTKLVDSTTKIVNKIPGVSTAINSCLVSVGAPPLGVIDKAVDTADSSLHKINNVIDKSEKIVNHEISDVKNHKTSASDNRAANIRILDAKNSLDKVKNKRDLLHIKRKYLKKRKQEYSKKKEDLEKNQLDIDDISIYSENKMHLSRILFLNQKYLKDLSGIISEENEPTLIVHFLESFKEALLNNLNAYEKLNEYLLKNRNEENVYKHFAVYALSLLDPKKEIDEIQEEDIAKGIMHNIDLIEKGMFIKFYKKIKNNILNLKFSKEIQNLKKEILSYLEKLYFINQKELKTIINKFKNNNFQYLNNFINKNLKHIRTKQHSHIIDMLESSFKELVLLVNNNKIISKDLFHIEKSCKKIETYSKNIMKIINEYKEKYSKKIKQNSSEKEHNFEYENQIDNRKNPYLAKIIDIKNIYNEDNDKEEYLFSINKLLNDIIYDYKMNLIDIKENHNLKRRKKNKLIKNGYSLLKGILREIPEKINLKLDDMTNYSKFEELLNEYKSELKKIEYPSYKSSLDNVSQF